MNNVHYLHHIFRRILSTNLKGKQMPPRREKLDGNVSAWKRSFKITRKTTNNTQQRMAIGIIKGSGVLLPQKPEIGTVIDVCYNVNNEKDRDWNNVKVMWKDEKKYCDIHKISELMLHSGRTFTYYPDHLPVLGQYADGYFEANDDNAETATKKIKVFIWRPLQEKAEKAEPSFKPSLYLIFNSTQENKAVGNWALMEEILKFAQLTKLPCHVVGEGVLFHSGSTESVCIHYKTRIDTIKDLKKKGFYKFERGDEHTEDEIKYFIQMAEYAIGEKVLPVIISLRNGVMTAIDQQMYKYPIICFKKNTQDVNVLWPTQKSGNSYVEYRTDTKKPWRVKIFSSEKKNSYTNHCEDVIEILSDIGVVDLNTLLCNVILGVSFEEASSTKKEHDQKLPIEWRYTTALSIHLLKRGEWTISKQYMKRPFDQISLEYIYEKLITSEFIENVWSNQKCFSTMGYKVPEYLEKVDNENKAEVSTDDLDMYRLIPKGQRIEFIQWNSECYGLIFLALLQKKYWNGAKQLVETGYIGIHYILIGCAIIEDEVNSGHSTILLKESLQSLRNSLTEKAISITSCIYEADKQSQNDAIKFKEVGSEENKKERELGDCINHAGRLLLNHGYLKDAIDTQNHTFLENDTVRKILRKIFYGTERVHWKTIGFLYLLVAYAYMLLFDYKADGITYTDYFIIAWMTSFCVDEIKQVIVAFIRGKWKSYSIDCWNLLDWMLIAVYTAGMLLKFLEGSGFQMASKLLLVAAFMALCTKLLHLSYMTEFLGRKLIINRKMIKDTIAFMIIIIVIMLWYSISFYALLYPNTEFKWTEIEKILTNGYWMLFGDLHLDATEPDCTFNRTIYESGILQRCPSQLGLYVTPYLKAFYGLIAVVLLLNLLIAMYSDTYNRVQENANFIWLQMQTDLFEEYSIKTVFPVHLQLLALPGIILALLWVFSFNLKNKCCKKSDEKAALDLNQHPMFVRVFLYDTNFDLRLNSTNLSEEKGILKHVEAKRETHIAENEETKTKQKLAKIEEMTEQAQTRLEKIEESIKGLLEINKMPKKRPSSSSAKPETKTKGTTYKRIDDKKPVDKPNHEENAFQEIENVVTRL
ncbi:unnamed protein product [Mytilus coruscus]|uniref:Uncharacterized protein n=1 Tax=Mytilus coruscus TaxID=42192 RepID=A0A6J8F3D4_MYTCO|nr:unnamed protein product [Mytilus coruscus]